MDHERDSNGGPTVVLVHPSPVRRSGAPWCDLPLESIAVGSPLVRAGYRVLVIDQRVRPDWHEALMGALAERPVCVGVTSTTGPQLPPALEVSRIVKRHGETPVVWGGIHATLLPEQTLERPEIDYVVQGEGERTFEELVRVLHAGLPVDGIAGLWHKAHGRLLHGPPRPFIDLDAEPAPVYDLVDVPTYAREVSGLTRLAFSTSRGCTFPCAFCYSTVVHRRRWRALSAEVALDQIEAFRRRYGVRGLLLTDANFFLDADRARTILEGVVHRRLDVVFTRLHIRLDALRQLTDADLALAERAGCLSLALGVESGSPRIRALLNKPIDADELLAINRRMTRFAITPVYFFMVGLPTETMADLKATVALFTRLTAENPKAHISTNVCVPYPGTRLFDLAVEEGLEPPSRMEDWFSFSYRQLGARGPWLSDRTRKAVEMLDFCSFFASDLNHVRPFKPGSVLASAAARVYAPFARMRMKHLFYQVPAEIKLARALGLYGRTQ